MTNFHKLSLSVFLLSLLPVSAGAEPSAKEWAKNRVHHALVKALDKQDAERSRFSRVIQPPRERRLRVLADVASHDDKGRAFVPYAIDVRYGDEWRTDISGCVYRKTGQIYVQLEDEYRPAEFLLGEDVEPVKGVCVARPEAAPRA